MCINPFSIDYMYLLWINWSSAEKHQGSSSNLLRPIIIFLDDPLDFGSHDILRSIADRAWKLSWCPPGRDKPNDIISSDGDSNW